MRAGLERRHGRGARRRRVCRSTTVEEVTGAPEMLGDRVKTLHPKIHGGILADRSEPDAPRRPRAARHRRRSTSSSATSTRSRSDPSIELIDVGGPTMVRAAAKNHAHVGRDRRPPPTTRPVLDELRPRARCPTTTRRRAALEALRAHGGLRRRHRRRGSTEAGDDPVLPAHLDLALEKTARRCATARTRTSTARGTGCGARRAGGTTSTQHAGWSCRYLNLLRRRRGLALVHDLG